MKSIRIVEVGPRDGLQNVAPLLSVEEKLRFVELLVAAGHTCIELSSFVHPKWVPQLADSKELVPQALAHHADTGVRFCCLVPNLTGLENALACGASEIAVFLSASETFSHKNINASISESFARANEVVQAALEAGCKVRGYLSMVFGCPYEGVIDPEKVIQLTKQLFSMGVYEVSLGDTIGAASPSGVTALVEQLKSVVDPSMLAMHFHDTRGLAIANVVASLAAGIEVFDASAGGLGGCPYARGASGNLATDDLLSLCAVENIATGVDPVKHNEATRYIYELLGGAPQSKSYFYYASRK